MSADLRALATTRLAEAEVLLANGMWSGAYYLSGYSVECGLKAVIVRAWQPTIAAHGLPPKKLVNDTYVHDLMKLAGVAGLTGALAEEVYANPQFRNNWEIVKDWTEGSRYELWSQPDAEAMVEAIRDPNDGVMRWLQRLW